MLNKPAARWVPVTDRDHDRFLVGAVDLRGVEVLFVEGTYVCALDVPAVRIFIDRDQDSATAIASSTSAA